MSTRAEQQKFHFEKESSARIKTGSFLNDKLQQKNQYFEENKK